MKWRRSVQITALHCCDGGAGNLHPQTKSRQCFLLPLLAVALINFRSPCCRCLALISGTKLTNIYQFNQRKGNFPQPNSLLHIGCCIVAASAHLQGGSSSVNFYLLRLPTHPLPPPTGCWLLLSLSSPVLCFDMPTISFFFHFLDLVNVRRLFFFFKLLH